MEKNYLLAIDQSTQGTKALIFDQSGKMLGRSDLAHCQIIDQHGWVSHDLDEIYRNTLQVVRNVVAETGIDPSSLIGVGISNQRETSAAWDGETGRPLAPAVVWQCARARDICQEVRRAGAAEMIFRHTGLQLSPYFPAAKFAWLLRHIEAAAELQRQGRLRLGTIDSWLLFKLTGGSFKTDYSNASRTQLFNLERLEWDREVCALFGINPADLPEVCDSDSIFGVTDFGGFLNQPIPICAVLGDSHGALFGQGCLEAGMIKTTYGTGSSIMMNIGAKPILSKHGLVTSLAWGRSGRVQYVLEGNINYTGAVIKWLQQDLGLIPSAAAAEELAKAANPADQTYLVPAFSGLGAPYWDSDARANISGITRTTGRAEIVRAALDSITYQITDVLEAMTGDTGIPLTELRVDGGPTRNNYLMQFQSDISKTTVRVPEAEELSGIGAAYMAGLRLGLYNEAVFNRINGRYFQPEMDQEKRDQKYHGWKKAVELVINK